ncbi:TPA: ABC transporter ATP-binding protein [Clostridium perfringens]|jgi:putative ABC transport system ATP-binding protein|nr:ABC transporter ATP-binding protein [Clostridium perfringens]EHA6442206.1 ABC transporter ATP-binding protein [Clostridium perfringens]EJT5915551.1 ABC transporter ATP-binding protein [Clostridium perfringens]EJT5926359.1 ABC transporter ATP-binding protein [Clostridium perfringens]MDH5087706.1 Macrolide export ATP-binding/permease protein MacB [Clostridium perfringens]UBK67510.1 ABC transporter ATP-binding protein [Clostridium perfringens]
MKKPIIKVRNLSKEYLIDKKPFKVLDSINLDVYENDMIAIMGKSGSGKSTFLNILGCIDKLSKGEYLLNDLRINDCKDKKLSEIRSKEIGFVFQNFNLINDYTVLDNVKLGILYKKYYTKENLNAKAIALNYLKSVGMENKINKYPFQLSGGEQQRVAIARALASNPSIILADEPTGALDIENTENILKLLKEINQKGKTVIIITHDINVAKICDKIVYLKDGKLINDDLK